MIDAAQMRAARALLNWKQTTLAEISGVSLAGIKNIESGAGDPSLRTMQAILEAFQKAGVFFLKEGENSSGGRGVRFK